MNPESRLVRCRWVVVIWVVAFVAALVGSLSIELLMAPLSGFWIAATMFFIAYAGIALGLYIACRSHGIRIRELIGPIPPVTHLVGYSLMAIPIFLSSLGGLWLVSQIAPHLLDGFVSDVLKNKPAGALQIVLTFLVLVVIGPVLEEFTFRGLLFTRLSVKYSPRKAIVISSLMFGVLHFDFFGAFIFGFVAATLYARSGSLLAPLALHSTVNLIAFSGIVAGTTSTAPIPAWLGLSGLLIGLAICAGLFALWARTPMGPPYIANPMVLANGDREV